MPREITIVAQSCMHIQIDSGRCVRINNKSPHGWAAQVNEVFYQDGIERFSPVGQPINVNKLINRPDGADLILAALGAS